MNEYKAYCLNSNCMCRLCLHDEQQYIVIVQFLLCHGHELTRYAVGMDQFEVFRIYAT